MKLSDFDLPKTPSGDPCWTSGAKTNAMIKGKLISSGVTYRLKEHSSPVWKKWSTTLRDMERERQRLISAGESIDCIDNEINAINTPERKRAWDEEDALSDVYLDAKNRMNQMFARPEFKDIIYCADEMWIERRGSTGQFKAIEAVRECDVTMGFEEGGLPLVFYRLPDEKAQCDILATFADAYAKIHKLGIIHSDIKMHNMLIGRAGASPHVGKLIDFDAAFFASDLRANVGNMVYVLNTIGGTLMAPELSAFYGAVQNGGHDRFDLSRITTKLDVFSFAMSIYECMYGKEYAHLTPFDLYYNDSLFVGDDGTPIPFSMPVEINDCDEMDASFSIRPPREFEENHPFLHALLRWMLAFNPADRPTMEQVATVLRGYQTYQDTGITDIPAEYLPIDIHSPWPGKNGEEYEFHPEVDPSIQCIMKNVARGEGWYIIKRTNGSISEANNYKDLLARGLLTLKGAGGPARPAGAPAGARAGGITIVDHTVSIRPNPARPGYYFMSKGGVEVSRSEAELIREGYAVAGTLSPEEIAAREAELSTPWPEDGIIFTSAATGITRHTAKGVGFYLMPDRSVRDKIYLVGRGFAKFAPKAPGTPPPATSEPWPSDNIRFTLPLGVRVERGATEGTYTVYKGPVRLTKNAKGLIADRLAVSTAPGAHTPAPATPKAPPAPPTPTLDAPWESDRIVFVEGKNVSITRGATEGRYVLVMHFMHGATVNRNKDELIRDGYARPIEE